MKYVATTNFKCGQEITVKGSEYLGGDIDELLRKKLIAVAPQDDVPDVAQKAAPEVSTQNQAPAAPPKGKKSKKG